MKERNLPHKGFLCGMKVVELTLCYLFTLTTVLAMAGAFLSSPQETRQPHLQQVASRSVSYPHKQAGFATQRQENTEKPTVRQKRITVLETAKSLVGVVTYEWGAKGNEGETPKQLDCSGFTNWVFQTAGLGDIGEGTVNQIPNTTEIDESELLPGDLAFLEIKWSEKPNHVGIYVGKDENGENLYIHCADGTQNGVAITTLKTLIYFRRPACFG